MKRFLAILLITVLLAGCAGGNSQMDRALAMRDKLLKSQGCTFDAVITADYGDKVYTFSMHCQADAMGDMTFTVTDPETISGITGTVSREGGKLTFDDTAVAFPMLADGQVIPVSAPWLLVHTLRSGYLTACGRDGEDLRLTIDDSYADEALQLDIWIDPQDLPVRGEILWQGRRVLSLEVRNFAYV